MPSSLWCAEVLTYIAEKKRQANDMGKASTSSRKWFTPTVNDSAESKGNSYCGNRSFAHCYDIGRMRRAHLRGHENILKRLLLHAGAFHSM